MQGSLKKVGMNIYQKKVFVASLSLEYEESQKNSCSIEMHDIYFEVFSCLAAPLAALSFLCFHYETLSLLLEYCSGGCSEALPLLLEYCSGGCSEALPLLLEYCSGGCSETLPLSLEYCSGGCSETLPLLLEYCSGGCCYM